MRSTTIRYLPCKCVARGNAFVPGMRGHLVVQVLGRVIPIRKCLHCRR